MATKKFKINRDTGAIEMDKEYARGVKLRQNILAISNNVNKYTSQRRKLCAEIYELILPSLASIREVLPTHKLYDMTRLKNEIDIIDEKISELDAKRRSILMDPRNHSDK